MTTATLSVGINTLPAKTQLSELKKAMQAEMKGIVLTLNDTAFTNSIQAALNKGNGFKVTIDKAHITSQISEAVNAGLAGTHTVNVDVKGGAAASAQLQQFKVMAAEIEALLAKAGGKTPKGAGATSSTPNKVPAVEATEGTDIGYQIKYAQYLKATAVEQEKLNQAANKFGPTITTYATGMAKAAVEQEKLNQART